MLDPSALAPWILRASTDGIWILDGEGRTLFANERLAEILGSTPAEMATLNIVDFYDEVGQEQTRQHLADLRAGKPAGDNVECSMLRRDGTRLWALISHSPVLDEDGNRHGWLHRVTELTERKLLLDKVLASEQQFAAAQAIAKVGSWEWDVATNVVTWSDQLYRIYNLEPQQFEATYEGFLGYIHPDDRPHVEAAVGSCFAGRDAFEFEARVVRQGGGLVWIRGSGVAVRDPDTGQPTRMSGTAQDITESKTAELALSAASARLELLQTMTASANQSSTLDEAVGVAGWQVARHTGWAHRASYLVDEEGQVSPEWASPACLQAIRERRLAHGHTSGDLTGPKGSAEVVAVPVVLGDRVCRVLEFAIGDGAPASTEILTTIGQVAGQLERVAEREQSARELAAARDAAMDASRMKSDFLATMSHEIRTPLNGVIGLTDLLVRTELDEQQQRLADGVAQAGRTLLGLVNDILDLSKIEAGKLEIEVIEFDVRDVVEQVASLMAEQARNRSIELMVACRPGVPTTMRGDPVRFGQIVTNLMSNAVKFTENGEVTVRVLLQERRGRRTLVRVEVTDTGIGIPAEAQAILFDAFTQADSSTTRQFGGTGLGLAISRKLAEAMGGEIGVTSEVGKGSTFWFTADFEAVDHAGRPAGPAELGLDGSRMLVVDDNATNRFILSDQLSAWGVSAATSSSADEALLTMSAAADAHRPFDVVLLDMCMPGTDGIALAAKISADPGLSASRLLLLTSAGQVDEEALAQVGIGSWLSKPVPHSALHGTLHRLLGRGERDRPRRGAEVAPSGRGRVLVVEDNPVNQLVARGMVTSLGYDVDIAQDGVEAVAVMGSDHGYVAVLMDCQMPRLDGYAATEAIRKQEGPGHHVPIIAMTAAAISGERQRCLAAGMDDFMVKPVDRGVLESLLERWIQAETTDQRGTGTAVASGTLDAARMRMLRDLEPGDPTMFHGFVDSFLRSAPRDLHAIKVAVGAQDPLAVADTAHRLKGSASNLGVSRVAALSDQLEEAGRSRDLTDAAALYADLVAAFDTASAALRDIRRNER